MWTAIQCLYGVLLVLLATLPFGYPDVFTSSDKMARLAASEASLLKEFSKSSISTHVEGFIVPQMNEEIKRFTEIRSRLLAQDQTAEHPNSALYMMRAFLYNWEPILKNNPELTAVLREHKVEFPSNADLVGALSAITRLQTVYSIPTSDAYAGNYLGFQGPALSPVMAFAIGAQGFTDAYLQLSVEWLTVAMDEMRASAVNRRQEVTSDPQDNGVYSTLQIASTIGVLGRVYNYKGQYQKAKDMYAECISLDPQNAECKVLATELRTRPGGTDFTDKNKLYLSSFKELCSRPKNRTVKRIRPYNVCRFKPSLFLPYVRYKEEILSLSPYASIFYDVIHDAEIQTITSFMKEQMSPATVEAKNATTIEGERSEVRVSDRGWLQDAHHPTAKLLSRRVQDFTWLKTYNHNRREGPQTAEGFQMLNYGIGGHYNVHHDVLRTKLPPWLEESGVRIATVFLYLSNVEMGGYTVFTEIGVSVPPIKGAALFWYNVNTDQEPTDLALHAGCPVLKGHKWASNKWIWTYGNTYRCPCGATPNATRLDAEEITYSRRHDIFRDSLTETWP